MNKTLLIHNDNIATIDSFTHTIKFEPSFSDIDKYISLELMGQLKNEDFDIVYVKDNLSSNYLELYGLRVAYHIRLSEELEDKKYVPIVILSDIDIYALNKLTPMAKILFTKNVFLGINHFDTMRHFNELTIGSMTQDDYINKFLNLVDIEAPKDYTDHHDITNEWAIHQWSRTLGTTSDAIKINQNKISSMLYFKYLKALHAVKDDGDKQYEVEHSRAKGKIFYIDDEWDKGWDDILNVLFSKSQDIEFTPFKYDYKDTNKFSMIKDIKQEVEKVDPDVVILDLRLSQTDHNKVSDIEQYTGIEVLKDIKAINPGIQVIMMTATTQSVILEKLYDYGVSGYIKKEHPDDLTISTVENIDKLFKLTESGLERKYLKEIFITKSKIENILENDIFVQYILDKEKYEIFWIQLQVETAQVFDILSNSNSQNKFKYAMVSIASSMEAILSIFIKDEWGKNNEYWDGESCRADTLNSKLNELFYDKFGYMEIDRYRSKLKTGKLIPKRNDYLHSRKEVQISKDEISSWFNKLLKMIEIIMNPPNLLRYNAGNMVENLNNALNNK